MIQDHKKRLCKVEVAILQSRILNQANLFQACVAPPFVPPDLFLNKVNNSKLYQCYGWLYSKPQAKNVDGVFNLCCFVPVNHLPMVMS